MEKKDLDKWQESHTIVYTARWNRLKSAWLKHIRGVSFEEIVEANLLDIIKHPSKTKQQILIFEYKGYTWAVPYVIDERGVFLKTLYPSRKYHKLYKQGEVYEKI